MTTWEILRRLLFYVGLALACLIALGLVAALSVRTGIVVPGRWVGLTLWTIVVFWVVLKARRKYWARSAFWLAAGGLLAVHLLAFAAVLWGYPQ